MLSMTKIKKENFIIKPLELGNGTADILVSKDKDDKLTITAVNIIENDDFGVLSGKKLLETTDTMPNGDYKVKIVEDGNLLNIIAEFEGNYSGSASRTITKPKKTVIEDDDGHIVGEMEIFVQVDDTVDKDLNPDIKRVVPEGSKEADVVLKSFLDTFNDVTLSDDSSLKEKIEEKDPGYVVYSNKYIDLFETDENSLKDAEKELVEENKENLHKTTGKEIEDPIYLDLRMRQDYEVLTATGGPVSGKDIKGLPIDKVKVSEEIFTNAGEEVEIAFNFPVGLLKDGTITKCYVLRMHNRVDDDGKQTDIYEDEYVVNGKTVTKNDYKISFKTNKFSTYVVLYTQEPVPVPPSGGGGSTEPSNNSQPVQVVPITPYTTPMVYVAPKTGDTDEVYILIALLAAGACWLAYGMIKKRRKEQ